MKKLLISFILLVILPFYAQAAELTINTEEYPPFNYKENGQIRGMATEKLEKALKASGISYNLQMLSWSKAYDYALNQNNTCVYTTVFNEERKPLFKWVLPLAHNDWVFFAKQDSKIQINTLEDARQYNIGAYRNDALSIYLQQKNFKVFDSYKDESNVKLLEGGRIDLWATGAVQGKIQADKEGMTFKKLFTLKSVVLGLACNKNMDDAVIAKLQDAINKQQ